MGYLADVEVKKVDADAKVAIEVLGPLATLEITEEDGKEMREST